MISNLITFEILYIVCSVSWVSSLDNGLVLTPPMGWETWERFRCNVNCKDDPDDCISEQLIKTMADYMVSEGYLAAGYEYITTGDCFLALSRDSEGRLHPDPQRFPSGIKKLSDYVHSKGLKFGIAEDFGTETCSGYPGSEFYMQLDAQTFADWGVDYLKFDGCNSNPKDMDDGYTAMGFFLNKTGRPIVYSCEWPFYQQRAGMKPDYGAIQKACNLWRNLPDVQDSWVSMYTIINQYGEDKYSFAKYAKPGAWNDPDQLVIGNFGLSYEQSRVQMALWAIMASPLIMSNDLRAVPKWAKELLQNKHLIAINQDPLGIQGTRILQKVNGTTIQVWSRPVSPPGSFAIAFLQLENPGLITRISVIAQDIGLTNEDGYTVTDGFSGEDLGSLTPEMLCHVKIKPNSVEVIVAKPVR